MSESRDGGNLLGAAGGGQASPVIRRFFAQLCSAVTAVVLVGVVALLPEMSVPTAHAATRTVTVAIKDLEPFVVTHDGVKSGYTIDLLDAIAKRTDWDFTFVEGDTTADLLRILGEGRAEAAATAISITSDRAEKFDFSQPILKAGLQILVPVSEVEHNQAGLGDFLRLLFSKTMLIWVIAALILTVIPAHVVWLLERRDDNAMVSRAYFPGIFQAFAWGLGMLAAQADDKPRNWQTRVLSLGWAFVGVIFVAYFTAILTANLTVDKFESKIQTPTDLIGRRVCTVADTTSSDNLSKLGVDYTPMPVIEECYSALRDEKFDAIVFDAPVLQYYVLHDGAGIATIAGPVFYDEDYGIAFPLGSELRRQVDDALLSIRESGDFELIKQKWLG